jgi:hypothetical protein
MQSNPKIYREQLNRRRVVEDTGLETYVQVVYAPEVKDGKVTHPVYGLLAIAPKDGTTTTVTLACDFGKEETVDNVKRNMDAIIKACQDVKNQLYITGKSVGHNNAIAEDGRQQS